MRNLLCCIALTIFVFTLSSAQTAVKQTASGMILVEGGTFPMGSGNDDEGPVHPVTLSSFLLDQKEVTVAEYQAFCDANPPRSMPTAPLWGWNANDPIVNVSWDDAVAYAQWVGKRLPTEAEWEYAARGGKFNGKGYLYSGSNTLGDVAWYVLNSDTHPHPVGTRIANQLGLYDMSGNVWEWCSDTYDPTYYQWSPGTNPTGPTVATGSRVNRGGAWDNIESACRVSDRTANWQDSKTVTIGFRCAAGPPPAPPVPSLSSPPNGSVQIPYSITLSWAASAGATSFRVQLSTRAAFDTVAYDSSGITGASLQVRWLSGATTYYWRVFASSLVNQSDPSPAWSFTTATGPYLGSRIPIPGIVEVECYDAGGNGVTYADSSAANYGGVCRAAEGVDIEPCTDEREGDFNIGWTRGGEWTKYSITVEQTGRYRMEARVATVKENPCRFHLEVDNADITGPLYFEGTGGWQSWISLSDTVEMRDGNHVLCLRIDPVSSGVDEGNFNWLKFTFLGPLLPTAPTNLRANAVSESKINLSWTDASDNEEGFRIERAAGDTISFGVVGTVPANTTSFSNSDLAPATTYAYRICAYNSSGSSTFSSIVVATTPSVVLSTPTLISPANGASDLPTTGLVFRWSRPEGASHFSYQLGTDPTFGSGLVKNDTGLVDTSRLVSGLSTSTTYYWRVHGDFGGVAGPWSSTFSFHTYTPLPGGVTLVSPAHNQVLFTNNVQFIWRKSSPPGDRYELDLCLDSMFTGFMNVDSTITDTVRFYSNLPIDQRWFWRVRAHSPGGWGQYSEGRAFTLSSTPTVLTLTVASSNPASGVAIGVTPADRNSQADGTTQFARLYNSGTTVTLTAPSAAGGNRFQKWLKSENDYATTGTINVLMDGDHTLTAVYVPVSVISVTAPSAGASWTVGTQQQVTWTSQNVTGDVNIRLSTDGGSNFPIILGTVAVSAGTATITVPDNPSTSCRVRVESIADASVNGTNLSNFSIIAAPTRGIFVAAPAAGANWAAGSQQTVSWTSQNVTGDVNILLSTDGGNSFPVTLATVQVAAGTASVTVPNAISSSCRVKVESSSDAAIYGFNPGNFSIVPAVRTLTINSVNPSSGAAIALSPADNSSQADGSTPLMRLYNSGTTVNLTAASSAGSGNTFLKWLRDSVDYATTANLSILMDADYVLTAVYAVPPPPPPTATNARTVAETSFEATWTGVAGATSYALEVATDNAFNSHVTGYIAKDVGSALRYPVSGLTPGTLYYYRVYATNDGGRSLASSTITVRTYVTSYSVTGVNIPFPSHAALSEYKADEYQLIGIPGDSRKDISAFLSGSHKQDWQVYWDNGKAGEPADYYVEYQQGTPNFTTSAGRAFWILHKDNLSLAGLASPASLDTAAGTVAIPLISGQLWNLITNPFNITIPWQGVINANGLTSSTALYKFQQQWTQSVVLDPYVGYLFANADGKSALRIPYHLTVPGAVSKVSPEAEAEAGWRVNVAVRTSRYEDRTSWFGVRPDAVAGKDRYEQYKPRHLSWVADVYFDHPDWDSRYSEFATDVRPATPAEELQVWELVLRADGKREPVQIEFTGLSEVPGELAVYLLDEAGGRSLSLRKEAWYVFTPALAETKLQVLVGKEDEVKERAASALPRAFALLPNYPNPFNPATTIPVVIPVKGQVSVVIYNVLGQRVRQLIDGILEPGIHYLQWQGMDEAGRSVSSGIYYCRMQGPTGSQTSRSLVLIR